MARLHDRFLDLSGRAEKVLVRVIVVCLALLVASQILLGSDETRRFISFVDRLEGEAWNPATFTTRAPGVDKGPPPTGTGPTVTVTLVTRPRAPAAVLLVNGVEAGRFTGGEVTARVAHGDLVEIDSPYLSPLIYRVTAVGGGVREPVPGTEVAARGGIVRLGKVKVGN